MGNLRLLGSEDIFKRYGEPDLNEAAVALERCIAGRIGADAYSDPTVAAGVRRLAHLIQYFAGAPIARATYCARH